MTKLPAATHSGCGIAISTLGYGMSFRDFRSTNAEEIQHFLSSIHVENRYTVSSPGRIRIFGHDLDGFSYYRTSGTVRSTLACDRIGDGCVIHSVIDGAAELWRAGRPVRYGPGSAGPLSPAESTRIKTPGNLALKTIIIDSTLIDTLCAKWLGCPIDGPVTFEHRPFSKEVQQLWDAVTWSLDQLLTISSPSEIALHGLIEYAVSLLLQGHPHNFSSYLEKRETLDDEKFELATKFIEENVHLDITPADVEAHIECNSRVLHKAFCERAGGPPSLFIYMARVARKHRHSSDALAIADIGRESGGRNMGLHSEESLKRQDHGREPLAQRKIELLHHHINSSLGNPVTVDQLARLVGMSRQRFSASFKQSFGVTPGQYMIVERLEWARRLLTSTSDSIAHIAIETGFSSQAHLTSVLRKYDGVTPKQLRMSSGYRRR